jgi:transcriptional regulator with XRE-family HTH domain
MPRNNLSEYVKQVMKLKKLTQKDVQRLSGNKITDGYVASIAIGRARNPSVDKLKALATGLGVELDEIFHVACGNRDRIDRSRNNAHEAQMLLQTIQKAVMSPDVTQILDGVVRLSHEERDSLLGFIRRLGATRRKTRRRV